MSVLRVFLLFAVESFARNRECGMEVLVEEVNTRSVRLLSQSKRRTTGEVKRKWQYTV